MLHRVADGTQWSTNIAPAGRKTELNLASSVINISEKPEGLTWFSLTHSFYRQGKWGTEVTLFA